MLPRANVTGSVCHRICVSPDLCVTKSVCHRIRVSPDSCVTGFVCHRIRVTGFVDSTISSILCVSADSSFPQNSSIPFDSICVTVFGQFQRSSILHVSNSIDSAFRICVNAPPVLCGGCHRLTLAPYGTYYSRLADHMEAAAISPRLADNYWARPIVWIAHHLEELTREAPYREPPSREPLSREPPYSLLPPGAYMPFHVPVTDNLEVFNDKFKDKFNEGVNEGGANEGGRNEGGGNEGGANEGGSGKATEGEAGKEGVGVPPVCELPVEYAMALASRIDRLLAFKAELSALECSACSRRNVCHAMQTHFKEWLLRTGNVRQLHDLMHVSGGEDATGITTPLAHKRPQAYVG